MCVGLHVKYRLLLSDCNETWISWHFFFLEEILKYQISHKSFHRKPKFPCGGTDTDTTKLTFGNRNSAISPKGYELGGVLNTTRQGTIFGVSFHIFENSHLSLWIVMRGLVRSADYKYCRWIIFNYELYSRWRSWLRHCATSREVAGSIPDCVIGIFHWYNPSGPHYGPGFDSASKRYEYQEYFLG